MSENAPDAATAEDQVEESTRDEPLGESGLRALERERAAAKTAKAERDEFAARLKAIEDGQKSEAEKASEELQSLRSQVAKFETQKQRAEWVAEVSNDTGIPAGVLRGSTLEDLQAHAAELRALIGSTSTGPQVPDAGKTPERNQSDEAAFVRDFFGNH